MYFVYVLRNEKDGNLYIGKTNDIKRRLVEHNSGHTQSLKSRRPFVLLEVIECDSELDARKLEKEYKKGYKREELRKKHRLLGGVA
jgi:putative endonuclease